MARHKDKDKDKVVAVKPIEVITDLDKALELFRITQADVFAWKDHGTHITIVTKDAKKLIWPRTTITK